MLSSLRTAIPSTRGRAALALALLVPAASLGGWMAFVAAPGPVGQGLYTAAKIWILLVPLLWRRWVERAPWSLSPLPREQRGRALLEGVVTGIAMGAVLYGVWLAWGASLLDVPRLREAAEASGFGRTPAVFLGFALYITFVNSLLEEYVWRWFVLRRCGELVGALAVPLAALLFTLHHGLAFAVQFDPLLVALASAGVFGAGCVWGWQYRRWGSIWPGYVSHVMVDAVALWIGWQVLVG